MNFEHESSLSKKIKETVTQQFYVETKKGKILCGNTSDGKAVARVNGEWGYRDWWGHVNTTVGDHLRNAMGEGQEPPPIPKRGNFVDVDAARQLAEKNGYEYAV